MTLAQLRARVRFFIDEPTQQNFLDSDINNSINAGQQEVAKEISHVYEDYFEKQATLNPNGTPPGTIAGVELYTLPTDFREFKRIERTDTGEVLTPVDLNEKVSFTSALVPLAISGYSLSYYVTGNSVGFTPTPASAIPILMTYVYRLVDLASDSDVSDIPGEFHDLMALHAGIECFIKDESDTSALKDEWNDRLGRMIRTLRQRQIQAPKHVRRVDSGYGVLF